MRKMLWLVPVCFFSGCSTPGSGPAGPRPPEALGSLSAFALQAQGQGSVISVPVFETTPAGVAESVSNAIARANRALDTVGGRRASEISFANTIRALDDIAYQAGLVANRVYLMKETSTNAAVRAAATEAVKEFEAWSVGLDYREDVYAAVQAYAASGPELSGEDKRYFERVMRDYRRAGLHLPKPERDEVERLRKELSRLGTDFDTHVTQAKKSLTFTRADLEGVPEGFLSQEGVKTGDDEYTVQANVTWHFVTVMENAKKESTRKRLKTARYSLAMEENTALLKDILKLRHAIAKKLGYATWADYRTEPKMAGTAAAARDFVVKLKEGLQPKFQAEIEAFRQLKVKETGDPGARIELWDWRYYSNQLKKERYTVDTEKLRIYFPYEATLHGMFGIYERIFSLKIRRAEPPSSWVGDVELYAVSDRATGEPLGLFYLDMFPREGKFNHFAQFGIIEGKRLPSGKYQRPTVALICNFPAPQKDKPSLLTHSDVETLFHEFGHAMHSILTRANYAAFSGTSVPRDFVEAPSQMLENWVWDKRVLDSFAANYLDPADKIPQAILDRLEEAKLATVGTFYRRQLSLGLLDLALHMEDPNTVDCVELSNRILGEVFLPVPDGTAFVAYFGHLTGYDAGYYGYAWADAIAADMATVFEESADGYYDRATGMKLREEIYAPGDSRDVNESIRRFLGRDRSIEPFLKTLGIGGN